MNRPLILPPLSRTASDARRLARVLHRDQADKAGEPYILHLTRVAQNTMRLANGCPFWSHEERDDAIQAAWLHDVVEDTPDGEARLEAEGFSPAVVEAVCWLSRGQPHDPGGSYGRWIAEIAKEAPLRVLLVKLADVQDNSDPERLAALPEADRERLTRKYAGAADTLREAARQRGWQE